MLSGICGNSTSLVGPNPALCRGNEGLLVRLQRFTTRPPIPAAKGLRKILHSVALWGNAVKYFQQRNCRVFGPRGQRPGRNRHLMAKACKADRMQSSNRGKRAGPLGLWKTCEITNLGRWPRLTYGWAFGPESQEKLRPGLSQYLQFGVGAKSGGQAIRPEKPIAMNR